MKLTPILSSLSLAGCLSAGDLPYPVVDTGRVIFYDNSRSIAPPAEGNPFHGQDAGYAGNQPSYRNNGDGTVSDLVTGLMWQQDPGAKMTHEQAVAGAAGFNLAGHNDWRLPSIKELYSLILFSGLDPDPHATATASLRPFIDSNTFNFQYGNPARGERIIDSQFATSTKYVSTTMGGNETMFGVNFADGRIKGQEDFPSYWTGTTHARGRAGDAAAYLAFGRGSGWMSNPRLRSSEPRFLDVHGAGCQRSDPKAGDPSRFPHGRGPQGDVIRIFNHVRCVRGGTAEPNSDVAEVGRLRAEKAPQHPTAPAPTENATPPPPPPPGHRPAPHFQRLDKNGDGKVSRREFDGPRRHFRDFDKDDDRYLAPHEFPMGPPPRR